MAINEMINPNFINNHLEQYKEDFPLLKLPVNGHRLAYLDNAATTQKPQCVMDSLMQYYSHTHANIHRGIHTLSIQATEQYENTRQIVKTFINAKEARECVFVRNTTEAINLVAQSFGDLYVKENDEILISQLEHHSNIVPWQMLCERKGATLKIIPIDVNGDIILEEIEKLFTTKTKLLAITQVSNAIGTLNPIEKIIELAKAYGIPVLIDGAQSAPHLKIDVQNLDCDFFTFSSHKTYGPTGVGVLYAKSSWLENMPPYQGGGEMILQVNFEKTVYNEIPFKFEAGTPAIAEVIAFGCALKYLLDIGLDNINAYEHNLLKIAENALIQIPGLKLIGRPKRRSSNIAFILDNIHPHDIGSIVDQKGVAIRTGHHCAMPLMEFFNIPAAARISFGLYNNLDDIDQCIQALYEVKKIFK